MKRTHVSEEETLPLVQTSVGDIQVDVQVDLSTFLINHHFEVNTFKTQFSFGYCLLITYR